MNETKKCPYCGEEIMATAKKCRFCGEWLETEGQPEPQRGETARRLENAGMWQSSGNEGQSEPKPLRVEQNETVPSGVYEQTPPIQTQPVPTIIINQQPVRQPSPEVRRNGMGTAGFVMSLVGLFVSWIPVLGWIIWGLGLIFSFVGVFKHPRSLAIAGLIVSVFGLILLIVISSALADAASEVMDWFDY